MAKEGPSHRSWAAKTMGVGRSKTVDFWHLGGPGDPNYSRGGGVKPPPTLGPPGRSFRNRRYPLSPNPLLWCTGEAFPAQSNSEVEQLSTAVSFAQVPLSSTVGCCSEHASCSPQLAGEVLPQAIHGWRQGRHNHTVESLHWQDKQLRQQATSPNTTSRIKGSGGRVVGRWGVIWACVHRRPGPPTHCDKYVLLLFRRRTTKKRGLPHTAETRLDNRVPAEITIA